MSDAPSDAELQESGGSARAVLDFVVRELVEDPDAVSIDEFDDDDRIEFRVTTAPDDVGRIIGRRGHVIQSIRTLVRAAASRDDLDADVEIND